MKRFTETTKWQDPWFRKLSPHLKCLWNYLCEACDAAGVIDPDWELISFQVGEKCTAEDVAGFGERIVKIENGKYFIPKFIEFQYGQLSRDCKAHNPVFKAIEQHKIERLCIGYSKGIHTHKEKDKEQDKEKDKKEDGSSLSKNPSIPFSLDEALAYATTQPGWSVEVVTKWFHSRTRQNWLTQNDRIITNWRSDLHVWVMNEAKTPKGNQYGTHKKPNSRNVGNANGGASSSDFDNVGKV